MVRRRISSALEILSGVAHRLVSRLHITGHRPRLIKCDSVNVPTVLVLAPGADRGDVVKLKVSFRTGSLNVMVTVDVVW